MNGYLRVINYQAPVNPVVVDFLFLILLLYNKRQRASSLCVKHGNLFHEISLVKAVNVMPCSFDFNIFKNFDIFLDVVFCGP